MQPYTSVDPALPNAELVQGREVMGRLQWVWDRSEVVNIRKGYRKTKQRRPQVLAGWGWLSCLVSEIRETWRVGTGSKGILEG